MKKLNETIDKYSENYDILQEQYNKSLENLAQSESTLRNTQSKLNEINNDVINNQFTVFLIKFKLGKLFNFSI